MFYLDLITKCTNLRSSQLHLPLFRRVSSFLILRLVDLVDLSTGQMFQFETNHI
ncbi:hypothetical protein HanRHA438_Chr16g0745021 [Helianthus annuus]|nr:hypothetical protein HanRHA438_Chr16g0745021 [Helianthus annuus]